MVEDWCGWGFGWSKKCRSVPWVWTSLIFGDDLKYHSEIRFRRLQEVDFLLRRGVRGEGIFKISIIRFTVFLLTKKKSLIYLNHGFDGTPSKLRTNRPKICQILGSTSVFSIFATSGGEWSNFCFDFNICCYYKRFLCDFIQNNTVRAHRASKQDFFMILHFVFHRLISKFFFFVATCKKYQI